MYNSEYDGGIPVYVFTFISILLFIFTGFNASLVVAAPMTVNASTSLGVKYEDNPGLSSTQQEAATGYTGIADMSVGQLSAVTDLSLKGRLLATEFADKDLSNDVKFLYLKSALNGERYKIRFNAKAKKDTTLVSQNDLTQELDGIDDDGGSEVDIDVGAPVERKVERTRYDYEPELDFRLSQTSSMSLGYQYRVLRHEQIDSVRLTDYTDSSASIRWATKLGLLYQLGLNADAGRFKADSGGEGDRATEWQGFGLSYGFNDSATSEFSTSVNYQKFTILDNLVDYSWSLSLKYRSKSVLNRWSVKLDRVVRPSSAGEMLYVNSARLNFMHRWSKLAWTEGKITGWQERAFQKGSLYQGRNRASAELVYGRRLSQQAEIRGSYRFRWREDDVNASESDSAESSGVFLSLVYTAKRLMF